MIEQQIREVVESLEASATSRPSSRGTRRGRPSDVDDAKFILGFG